MRTIERRLTELEAQAGHGAGDDDLWIHLDWEGPGRYSINGRRVSRGEFERLAPGVMPKLVMSE